MNISLADLLRKKKNNPKAYTINPSAITEGKAGYLLRWSNGSALIYCYPDAVNIEHRAIQLEKQARAVIASCSPILKNRRKPSNKQYNLSQLVAARKRFFKHKDGNDPYDKENADQLDTIFIER
jgi:hypothetical protein